MARLIEFTFHYVSTYTSSLPLTNVASIYLHSTMFLLIRRHLQTGPWRSGFTFHYVSTYTISRNGRPAKRITFTFHYVSTYTDRVAPFCGCIRHLHSTMFLLILFRLALRHNKSTIYIPLCFYLYWEGNAGDAPDRGNLHSTMFLLILFFRPGYVRAHKFTFHYVSTYTTAHYCRFAVRPNLHSTMFLLILKEDICPQDKPAFTFHYVSTYTNTVSGRYTDFVLIYIPLCFYLYRILGRRDGLWYNLHSTMFLLIHEASSRDIRAWFEFTFHYVSTYTLRGRCRTASIFNLHSTMFLLIQ